MNLPQTSSDPVHSPVIAGASTSGLGRAIFDAMNTDREHPVTLHVRANSIEFDGFYEIPFARIDTHEKLVRWIFHLHRKSWFTTDLAGKLIAEVSLKHGWEIYMSGI